MCFSATASFVGAGVIATIGVATLGLVREWRQLPLALMPLIFALHQALEGMTWLALDGRAEAVLSSWDIHLWALIAWALWPVYAPWAVWLVERDARRRRLMLILLVLGGALASYMAYVALRAPISVAVVDGHLDQHFGIVFSTTLLAIPYVLATCGAPILSSHLWVRAFGVANLAAMVIAAIVAVAAYASIWCALAAALSLLIFGHFAAQRFPHTLAAAAHSS